MRLRGLLIIMSLAISLIPVGIIGGFQGLESTSAFIGLIIVVTFFVSAIISYFITRPLETLTTNIDEISKGNLDVQIEKSEIFEINQLSNSLNRVLTSLKLAIHKVGVKKGEIFEETIKAKELAEEKYHSILKNLDAWVWEINEKGICTHFSEKITSYLGYTPEELEGKKIYDLISPNQTKHLKNTLHTISQHTTNNPINLRLCWRHKEGHDLITKTTFHPIYAETGEYLGIRGIGIDMMDLHTAEQRITELTNELGEMKKRFESYIQSEKTCSKQIKKTDISTIDKETKEDFDHTIVFDETSQIIEADPLIYQNLGYSRDEFLNMNLADLEFLETQHDINRKLKKVKNKGMIKQKSIIRRKDGSSIFVIETMKYLKDQQRYSCSISEEFSIDKKNKP